MSEAYTQLALIATEKRCKKCGEMKPLPQYSRHPTTHDRLQTSCKACAAAFTRRYYETHREQVRAASRVYSRAYYEQHRDEALQRAHRKYLKHRERILESNRRWKEANRVHVNQRKRELDRLDPANAKAKHYAYIARKKKNGGRFTAAEWRALCERYDNRCACCGESKRLTADHVIPLSKGGNNYITNIQPLCQSCNSSKGTKETDYRR